MAPFDVAVNNQPGCMVVTVTGELDISTAPQLEEALGAVGPGSGSGSNDGGRTVVDLNAVDFIDSTGLSVLVRAFKRSDEAGGDFSIVCGPEKIEVHRVLEILGFDEVFTIHQTLTDAGCGDQAPAS